MGIDYPLQLLLQCSMREVPLAPAEGGQAARFPLGNGRTPRELWAGLSLRAAGDLCHPERHSLRGRRSSADRCTARRDEFFRRFGVGQERLAYCRQVHSRTVVWVEDGAGSHPEADGMLTRREDVVCCVSVADCLPIFLAERTGECFGILHSGWRGTGILQKALEMLREGGVRAADLSVTIGPGIGSCCYAVDRERYELFLRSFGPASVRVEGGQGFLDLRGANLEILRRAGVEDVAVVPACTACTPALSSFRRDGPCFAHMLAFIGHIRSQEK